VTVTQAEAAKLYLVVGADVTSDQVAALLDAASVAALLIAPAGAGKPLDARSAKPLVDLAQAKGIAALIEADAQLARTLRADGVHVSWCKDVLTGYAQAREIVGGRAIVGADAGRSRHDAMELGEAGADYVGFGIPAHVEDRETARARQRELVHWWSALFEVPCVAFDVETPDEVALLAQDNADFVAVRVPAAATPDTLATWPRDIVAALTPAEDVA
jgi:thiamine-phosphate pyrophosphorylase